MQTSFITAIALPAGDARCVFLFNGNVADVLTRIARRLVKSAVARSLAKFRGEGYPPVCGVFGGFCLANYRMCFVQWNPGGSAVEYKQLIVKAFEQAPGKWRASVKRLDGKPLMTIGRAKLAQFITGLDSVTANDALLMAIAAIDAGAFSCRAPLAPASSSPSSRSSRRSLPPAARLHPSTVAASEEEAFQRLEERAGPEARKMLESF